MQKKLLETYPNSEPYINEIWPIKEQVLQLKLKGESTISFYQIEGEIRFMEIRDYPLMPMLRVLLRYPNMMGKPMVVDKGAIRHIFSGSHIMAPGLTSEGGELVRHLPKMAPVAVHAEGKEHAICIGVLSMSSSDIEDENKGQAIEVVQFYNDGIWFLRPV